MKRNHVTVISNQISSSQSLNKKSVCAVFLFFLHFRTHNYILVMETTMSDLQQMSFLFFFFWFILAILLVLTYP